MTVNDRKLGYRDNTNVVHDPADPTDAMLLAELVEAHLRDHSASGVAIVTSAQCQPPTRLGHPEAVSASSRLKPWDDLAVHQPGRLARARAEEEWRPGRRHNRVDPRLWRLLNVDTDERAWRISADDEEAVGNQLEKQTQGSPLARAACRAGRGAWL